MTRFPITSIALGAAALALAASTPAAARGDEDAAAAIRWETDLDAALARAAREGKPILLVQGFGRPGEPFC